MKFDAELMSRRCWGMFLLGVLVGVGGAAIITQKPIIVNVGPQQAAIQQPRVAKDVRQQVIEADAKASARTAPAKQAEAEVLPPPGEEVKPESLLLKPSENITPPGARFGWSEKELNSERTKTIKKSLPKFIIKGGPLGDDSVGKKRFLWEVSRQLLGHDLPCYRQEIGDCVSMGAAKVVDYLQLVEIAAGEAHEYNPAYQPYIYGISRVQIGGGRINGDGSVGSWAAEGLKKYGVLRANFPGVPAYSGSVAKAWGRRPGPPNDFIKEGIKYPVKTFSTVRSYAEVRQAIYNGYPVTIASNVGFEGGQFQKAGRIFLKRGGSWAHQMAVIGVDDTVPGGAAFIQNSWGESAHPTPIDGAPKGGFWVEGKSIDAICSQDDSYAFSGFEGFPARTFDFDVLAQRAEKELHDVQFGGLVVFGAFGDLEPQSQFVRRARSRTQYQNARFEFGPRHPFDFGVAL